MSNREPWFYYADALPEYARKLVRIGDGKAERYTTRNGWVDAGGIESEVKWTGDWDLIWDDDVDTVIANIDNPKPPRALVVLATIAPTATVVRCLPGRNRGRCDHRRPDTAGVETKHGGRCGVESR